MEQSAAALNSPSPDSDSPPQKKSRNCSDENLQPTSNYSATFDNHLTGVALLDKQPTDPSDVSIQQPLNSGFFKFILPSEEDCILPPEEHFEPNSVGSKSLETSGVWHKPLEESYAAQVRKRSLFGHIVCPEETQKKIRESDICSILE